MEQIAMEFDVAPKGEDAAKAYAEHEYGEGPYGEKAHEMAYEGCLEGFRRPPPAPPPSD